MCEEAIYLLFQFICLNCKLKSDTMNIKTPDVDVLMSLSQQFLLDFITKVCCFYKNHLYTEILEVNLLAFAYRLFHEDFSILNREKNHLYYESNKRILLHFSLYLPTTW